MSDDQPESSTPVLLRREALLPNERNRGLGTVAVVCTMAGVASGLALATTLMAMQVADSMSTRGCPYAGGGELQLAAQVRQDHGFLGITYTFERGAVEVKSVVAGTPAEMIGLAAGDHIFSLNGRRIRSGEEFQARVYGMHPGSQPTLVIGHGGETIAIHPTLIAFPSDLVVGAAYGQ